MVYQKSRREIKHVLLLGDSQHEAISTFLKECFHSDHGTVDNTEVVIMRSGPPSEEISALLSMVEYDSKVIYLEGSPLNHDDLRRCMADQAQCAVIMTNHFCENHQAEDYKNILSAFAIKKYVKQKHQVSGLDEMRVCLQIAKPEHKDLYYSGLAKS